MPSAHGSYEAPVPAQLRGKDRALLDMRSAEQKRDMEGIARVNSWTVEKLIANPNDWDTAQITVSYPDGLEELDQAGILLDLSQSAYLSSRKSIEKGVCGWDGMPNVFLVWIIE